MPRHERTLGGSLRQSLRGLSRGEDDPPLAMELALLVDEGAPKPPQSQPKPHHGRATSLGYSLRLQMCWAGPSRRTSTRSQKLSLRIRPVTQLWRTRLRACFLGLLLCVVNELTNQSL